MTPEQKARQEIDRQLEQCGWVVQSFRDMNISAGLGVAVREFPLKSGQADYLLYADCKALGVIEAKPEATPSPASKPSPASTWTACPRACPISGCRCLSP